ncbi:MULTISPECIES: hypothetical protein [Thermomonospora]|uniref:hypothetical protein n=1 Tax=Thermomonospora TaxID=2019 RepID=UPI00059B891C|nr:MULTISPECIES: hypothetical protein [Thermomonospora]PKK16028.1 MAG: hypothetical protein BUE48_001935 [Thermomonospora sp. CIF 1]
MQGAVQVEQRFFGDLRIIGGERAQPVGQVGGAAIGVAQAAPSVPIERFSQPIKKSPHRGSQ